MERNRDKQKDLHLVYIDLKKKLIMIKDMYYGAKACVRTCKGEAFHIKVGLRQELL